jgi:hypothetical protein
MDVKHWIRIVSSELKVADDLVEVRSQMMMRFAVASSANTGLGWKLEQVRTVCECKASAKRAVQECDRKWADSFRQTKLKRFVVNEDDGEDGEEKAEEQAKQTMTRVPVGLVSSVSSVSSVSPIWSSVCERV